MGTCMLVALTNTDDSRRLRRGIVQDTLPHIVVQVGAVMIRLNRIAFGILGICMKRVQMCADSLYRCEVLVGISMAISVKRWIAPHLHRTCASLERLVGYAFWVASCFVADRERVHLAKESIFSDTMSLKT